MLCGGGTGGHITPILAIAHEIKLKDPTCTVIYVGEHAGKFADLTSGVTSIDEVRSVFAGKFRRYHKESWLTRIADVKTNLLNVRDIFFVFIGIFQSLFLLRRLRPSAIYVSGYVGMPIGLAATFWKIPFITHDSDATPGLTNRIVGKWATFNAVGLKKAEYGYKKDKTVFTGVPVSTEFKYVSDQQKQSYRSEINIPVGAKMLLITGGSLGAVRVNKSFALVAEQLLDKFKDLYIFHQVGKGNMAVYSDLPENQRLKIYEFIPDLYKYSGAADVVITRGGANTTAELAIQGKACILIPNPLLTGGHQMKNAELFASTNSAVIISEDDLLKDKDHLFIKTSDLLNDVEAQKGLSQNINQISNPKAAEDLASLLISLAEKKQ